MSQKSKIVLITGAGRGLGRATAEAFHKAGFEVVATDIDLTLLEDLSKNRGYTCLQLDVTSENDVSRCAEFVEDNFGKLDVLISNAGIVDFYPLVEAGSEKLNKILEVNVLGLANLAKYFSPFLMDSKGRLIVIGSESYKVPAPFQPYAVSKKALEALFDSLRIELALKAVKAILVRPGAIQTRVLKQTIEMSDAEDDSKFKEVYQNFKKSVPKYIGKVSKPEEVARLVLKAATTKNPRRVYFINHKIMISILSALPKNFQHYLIKKQLD